jgi:hypothetical protein
MKISKLKLSVSSTVKINLKGILKVTNVRGIIVGDLVIDFRGGQPNLSGSQRFLIPLRELLSSLPLGSFTPND